MADEYQWLDQEAAERLLRGEPVDPVGTSARAEAELLARALDSARTPAAGPLAGPDGELPGEAAALAAFRKAVAERAAAPGHAGRAAAADLGAVRVAPVRVARGWGRSLRYGIAAAVAAVTVGGVAVAAGTGVLPLTAEPDHGASVVAVDPSSPGPSGSPTGGPDSEQPGGTGGGSGQPRTPGATDGTGSATAGPDATADGGDPSQGTGAGGTDAGTPEQERAKTIKACQDFRAGTLGTSGRQRLTDALRNGETVKRYCDRVLAGTPGGATPSATGRTSSGGTGKGGTPTGGTGGSESGGTSEGGSDGDGAGDRGRGDRGDDRDQDTHRGRGPATGPGRAPGKKSQVTGASGTVTDSAAPAPDHTRPRHRPGV
ncbi:hypothetical protein [Streptomyces sp. NPDC053541]|uniref:hypothetical protein n=1 Tax=Streptomyces sp. NPDC053541 TaxID=3365709 RepID=UPI0037D8310E